MILAALVSALVVAAYVYSDGLKTCNDGDRYVSGIRQPSPFNRRFCGWHPRVLTACTLLSLIGLGTMMGSWPKALLLLTLPGAWSVATHPTTVDAPAMLLSVGSSAVAGHNLPLAVVLSACSGFLHERGPVFAALSAGNAWCLLGLIGVGWYRRAAPPDSDPLVGQPLLETLKRARPYNDLLSFDHNVFALRGLPLLAIWFGAPPLVWVGVAVAYASRVLGTDLARFMWWSAPAIVVALPEVPPWAIAVHVMTFRRMA